MNRYYILTFVTNNKTFVTLEDIKSDKILKSKYVFHTDSNPFDYFMIDYEYLFNTNIKIMQKMLIKKRYDITGSCLIILKDEIAMLLDSNRISDKTINYLTLDGYPIKSILRDIKIDEVISI